MRRQGLWWAAAIVLVSNIAAWGAAARNRSGEPDAVLVLTERELRLPARQADNTALTLTLVYEPFRQRGFQETRDAGWFDQAKLQSIGFDCSKPVTPENASYYRVRIPRSTYAALEFEGDAWRAQVEGAGREPQVDSPMVRPGGATRPGAAGPAPRDPLLESHLVPIDVDNDPVALRARHPDRHRVAIVEATAAIRYVGNLGQAPFLAGTVTSVLPGEINVPREWRSLLEGLQSDEQAGVWPPPQHEPRFRATVTWGKRLEPWVSNVELLPAGTPR
jgi:hypothetical protein